MLSDNIRYFRKKNNLSQEELAEKIGVSRQSVSFWETGQTQPTIDNIIALSKIFNITSDMLLGNTDGSNTTQPVVNEGHQEKKKGKAGVIIAVAAICVAIAVAVIFTVFSMSNSTDDDALKASGSDSVAVSNTASDSSAAETDESGSTSADSTADNEGSGDTSADSEAPSKDTEPRETESKPDSQESDNVIKDPVAKPVDLFAVCRDFAIKRGELKGDFSIYQQPSELYGGYANEYFSITYWADSNMVEFCLHCPLDDETSHNFYLRMRGGYNKKYEYASSKYYRDTGESFRFAMGYIDPAVFSDRYPISCDMYEGSTTGQDQFMEDSRVGICDLIYCLKNFVAAEHMACSFSDFDFVNFD